MLEESGLSERMIVRGRWIVGERRRVVRAIIGG